MPGKIKIRYNVGPIIQGPARPTPPGNLLAEKYHQFKLLRRSVNCDIGTDKPGKAIRGGVHMADVVIKFPAVQIRAKRRRLVARVGVAERSVSTEAYFT